MTPAHRTRHERGAALLIVLGIVALIAVPTLSLARLAGVARIAESQDLHLAQAAQLLHEAERLAMHWLHNHADQVVLSAEVRAPTVTVVEDHWEVAGFSCAIVIHAVDQCGLVPLSHARGPLAATLTSRNRRCLADYLAMARPPYGLDQRERTTDPSFPSFPFAAALPLGLQIATHASDPAALNVKTAPLVLLEQAFRLAGRGGLDVIRQARAEEQPAPAEAWEVPETRTTPPDTLHFVSRSSAWSFRIDVTVGGVARSWWCTFTRPRSEWQLAQRLLITS